MQEVTITGIDTFGQIFTCNEFVWIYDSVFLCSNTINNPKAIGGRIITELNEPMDDLMVGLKGINQNYFEWSNEKGMFLFEDFAKQGLLLGGTIGASSSSLYHCCLPSVVIIVV